MNHILGRCNIQQPGITVGLLENPGNVHVQNFFLLRTAQRLDKISTGQNPVKVIIVKDPVATAWKAHGYTGNDNPAGIEIKFFNGLQRFFTLCF